MRLAAWEVARLRHGLDAAFDPPVALDGYATQNERDRLSGAERWLRERIWSGISDPLNFQKPERVAEMRGWLDKSRADISAASAKHPRSSFRFSAECALRRAEARFEREVAAAKATAASVGDIGAQLAAWQETFPQDSFDPSYTGEPRPDEVRAWGKCMRNWEDGIPAALAFFEEATEKSIEARTPEFRNYVGWFRLRVKDRIREAIRNTTTPWSNNIDYAKGSAGFQVDLASTEEFLNKVFRRLQRGIAESHLLEAFQEGYQGKADPEIAAARAALQASYEGMESRFQTLLKAYRLPPPASRDPALLKVARSWVDGMMGEGKYRGLRISQDVYPNDEREVSGEYVIVTWWRSFQVDFAANKPGTDRWYHESFRITRRVDSGGNTIWDWSMVGRTPNYSHPILEENIDEP